MNYNDVIGFMRFMEVASQKGVKAVVVDIRTEDGKIVHEGDRVYNYYDMKPCVIVPNTIRMMPDAWFDTEDDTGRTTVLNGQRICTLQYAQRRGFPNAA